MNYILLTVVPDCSVRLVSCFTIWAVVIHDSWMIFGGLVGSLSIDKRLDCKQIPLIRNWLESILQGYLAEGIFILSSSLQRTLEDISDRFKFTSTYIPNQHHQCTRFCRVFPSIYFKVILMELGKRTPYWCTLYRVVAIQTYGLIFFIC